MNPNDTTKETYLDTMGAAEKELAGAPSWLRELRRGGAARFAEVGFPTMREEEWKYTDVSPIVQAGFKPAARGVNGIDPRLAHPRHATARQELRYAFQRHVVP